MKQKKEQDNAKAQPKEQKDTGFKNKVIEYDEQYLDNSNAQE